MRGGFEEEKMAAINSLVDDKWYFTKEQLENTPSRRAGIAAEKELSYRQQAATLIQDMGQRLSVSQLTINTSIVYMHRFYMFFPFARFHRHAMAPCCLFLSAKVEEQPRKLKHVITVAHACLHRGAPPLDTNSEEYLQQAQDLIENESILLQTLGFEVTVHHPHTYVVKGIQLVRASKDLGQASYFMATNSLHLTTLCLQYKPTVVACACIHLACKWCNYEIPPSSDNKYWWQYMNADATKEMLDDIAQEFISIIEKCPSKLKRKINSITMLKGTNIPRPLRTNDQAASSFSLAPNGQESDSNSTSLVNDIARKCREIGNSEISKEAEKKDKVKPESVNHSEKNPLKSSTVTSEGASVATATTVVTLPVLPPLTTKYAAVTTAASQPSVSDPKVSTTSSQPSSTGTSKHKHRSSHEDGTPSKKHKSLHHSSRAHSTHSAHKSGRVSSSHSSDSSSPGKRPHGKPGHPSSSSSSSSSSSHKSSSHSSKHHHGQQPVHSSHKIHSSHRGQNPHTSYHSSHSSSLKLIPPSPTLGLLDKKRLSGSAKPTPPVPTDHDILPPPPPPPPPPSDGHHPMSTSSNMYPGLNRQSNSFSSIEQAAPPPPPPEPAPKSPPPPPPPPF